MYTYFLSDYISAMSSVDIRKLKKITKAEFIQLISLLISMFLVIVTMILYQLKRTPVTISAPSHPQTNYIQSGSCGIQMVIYLSIW